MSEQRANQDYRYPMAETYLYGPTTFGSFLSSDLLPIFWGPGQYTSQSLVYNPPNRDRWRNYEHLNIPVVARFIYDDDPEEDFPNLSGFETEEECVLYYSNVSAEFFCYMDGTDDRWYNTFDRPIP